MANRTSQPISVRLEATLLKTVKQWLKKNPGFSMSSLTALALQNYVTNDQVLHGVETANATAQETQKSLTKLMKKHKKALDEMK